MGKWSRTYRIVVCFALGAASTTAVALAAALLPPLTEGEGGGHQGKGMMGGEWMMVGVWTYPLRVEVNSQWVRSQTPPCPGADVERWWREVAPAWVDLSIPVRTGALFGDLDARRYDGFGWPYVALWRGEQRTTHTGLGQWEEWFSAWRVGRHALPIGVYPTGFAVDAVVFTFAWMTMFTLAGQPRKALRRRAGRCVYCGYDLRGDIASGCPECGWGRSNE